MTAKELSADTTELERVKEQIRFEVREALLNLRGAAQRISVAEKARSQAQENLRLQEARYREGEASATEVTDAVTTQGHGDPHLQKLRHSRRPGC